LYTARAVAQDFDDPFEEERAFSRYFSGRHSAAAPASAPAPRVRLKLPAPAPTARPEPARDDEPVQPLASASAAKPLSFVEVVLLDAEGKAVANEAYKIKLPDGSLRQGKLDRNGRLRIDGIEEGDCELEFPGLGG
jgi:hypothetical protein